MADFQAGGGGEGGGGGGGIGGIPLPNLSEFFTVDSGRPRPWENRGFVKQLFTRVLGCTLAAFDYAWRSKAQRRQLKDFAQGFVWYQREQEWEKRRQVEGNTRANVHIRVDAADAASFFRKRPGVRENLIDVLEGRTAPPCPGVVRPSGPRVQEAIDSVLRRRATTKAPAVVPGTSSSATGPPLPGGTGRPPGPLTQGALEQLLEIIEALREWWFAREQLKQQEDAARAARRAQMSGFGDFFTGLGQGVQSLATAAIQNASGIAQLVSSFQQPQQVSFAPTGSSGIPLSATAQNAAMQLFQQPQQAGVMDMLPLVPGIDDLIANLVPSNGGGGSNGFFKTTATGVRSVGQVHATNPKTGRIHVFADLGRPVLYSGDIATCKRVKKVARRTAGASGLRFRPVAARRRRR